MYMDRPDDGSREQGQSRGRVRVVLGGLKQLEGQEQHKKMRGGGDDKRRDVADILGNANGPQTWVKEAVSQQCARTKRQG